MRQIQTTIQIKSPPEKVWRVLMDFPAYPHWNPFITSIAGIPKVGAKIQVRLQPRGGMAMTFRPKIVALQTNKEFRWLGHLFIPGVFDGAHRFEIQNNGDATITFTQAETFTGLLVPLLLPLIEESTKAGFEAMNQKLKEKCEKILL